MLTTPKIIAIGARPMPKSRPAIGHVTAQVMPARSGYGSSNEPLMISTNSQIMPAVKSDERNCKGIHRRMSCCLLGGSPRYRRFYARLDLLKRQFRTFVH